MRIAVTGTPGVGKSTLAVLLREQGETVVDLKQWAQDHDAISAIDDDGTLVIDVDALQDTPFPSSCFIDGHLSHQMPVDAAWVVRCDPSVLRERLRARGYSDAKVEENVEAEAMDLILQEALDHCPLVVQRDGSQRSPQELLSAFVGVPTDTLKDHDLEPVDWSDRLLE